MVRSVEGGEGRGLEVVVCGGGIPRLGGRVPAINSFVSSNVAVGWAGGVWRSGWAEGRRHTRKAFNRKFIKE